jgi:UDPglucose 6-dehydrogenase
MSIAEAELVKQLSNVNLATRISIANLAGNICEEMGADVHRVMQGVGADRRIGSEFFEAGLGFGGSCFAKDAGALQSTARDHGVELPLISDVLDANREQLERVVAKLERRFPSLKGAQISLLGLAFKQGTDDIRESPALALAQMLRSRGARVRGWDPHAGARRRAVENAKQEADSDWMTDDEVATSDEFEAMAGADAVVIATKWPEFKAIDWERAASVMAGTLVIDGRNLLSPDAVRSAGLEYEGTGRESLGLRRLLV